MKLLSAIAACLLLGGCGYQSAVPARETVAAGQADAQLQPAGWVTDQAQVLSAQQEAALEEKLEQLSRRSGHQLVVVTVTALNGQTIDDYALRLAKRWGVGRKGYNDGVLLLVAPNERKVRIEVGLGLEQVLSDQTCREILDRAVLPEFRSGRIPEGIAAGAEALLAKL